MPDDLDYSQFIRSGAIPFGWTPPPGPTPGQVYAAFGDTGAASGDTEGVSPAMRQMIRRSLGRLAGQSMGERERTAEHAMRGAAMVGGMVNPVLGAGTAGLTSQFAGDTPSQTAEQVGRGLLPYAGRLAGAAFRAAPFTTTAAGATALGVLPVSNETVDAAEKKRQQAVSAAQAATPSDDEEREIAQLRADQARAVETGRHSKNPGDMAAAQKEFDQRIEGVRTRYRNARALASYKTGLENDADFKSLPDTLKAPVLKATSLDDAETAYRKAIDAVTPYAQKNADFVRNLELGAMGIGAALPFGHSLYNRIAMGRQIGRTEAAYNNASNAATAAGAPSAAAEDALNLEAGKLRSMVGDPNPNYWKNLGQEAAHHGIITTVHAAAGTALPMLAGTVFPNMMDSFTLPHESAGYKHAVDTLNPTSPEFVDALRRNAIEGGGMAAGGGIAGFTAFRPDLAKTRGAGVLNAIDQRTAGYKAPAGMQSQSPAAPAMPEPAPMPQPPSSPTRIPPPMWTQPQAAPTGGTPPPPLTSIPPADRFPGYIADLSGAALRSHLMRLERENPASFSYPPRRER